MGNSSPSQKSIPPVYVVSGATGTSARAVLDRALTQFPNVHVPVRMVPDVRSLEELEQVVQQAAGQRATIVHTLVDGDLRQEMIRLARVHNVVAIDLIGRLLERLSTVLREAPLEQPGLYHRLHIEDIRRAEAINFAVAHDDGQRIHELGQADIVIIGPSRVSKTPLSVYLSMQGWKVANIPLVLEHEPPAALFSLPRGRVVGLKMDPDRLEDLRKGRASALGIPVQAGYANLEQLYQEVEWTRLICRRGGFALLDVTNRSIEEMAHAVADLVRRRT